MVEKYGIEFVDELYSIKYKAIAGKHKKLTEKEMQKKIKIYTEKIKELIN